MLLFLVDLINIEIFRIPFSFFYSFYFILRSRATSEESWHICGGMFPMNLFDFKWIVESFMEPFYSIFPVMKL